MSGDDDLEMDPFFLTVHIRVASGNVREFVERVETTATVDQFKQQIRARLKVDKDQNLRLIHNGKLLGPDSSSIEATDLKNNAFVHAVISPKPPTTASSVELSSISSASGVANSALIDLRGLNALSQSHRLNADEIAALRAHFGPAITEYAAEQSLSRTSDESDSDFHFRLETAWMQAQDRRSEFRLNLSAATNSLFRSSSSSAVSSGTILSEYGYDGWPTTRSAGFTWSEQSNETGTSTDFLRGFFYGYTLGFMMIFCVWDSNFPYRHKLGVICGIITQAAMGMILHRRYQQQQSGSSSPVADNTHTTAVGEAVRLLGSNQGLRGSNP